MKELTAEQIENLRCKDLYTSGDVAKICSVSPRTATLWCEKGWLPSTRYPGELGHWRVSRSDLADFVHKNNLPTKYVSFDRGKILLCPGYIDGYGAQLSQLASVWCNASGWQLTVDSGSVIHAAYLAGRILPDVLILDFSLGTSDCKSLALLRSAKKQIAIVNEDDGSDQISGFDLIFKKPCDPNHTWSEIVKLIRGNSTH